LIVSSVINNENDASEIVFQMLRQLSKEDALVFACILWSIWRQRNNQIWNNITDAQSFVFSRANNIYVARVECSQKCCYYTIKPTTWCNLYLVEIVGWTS
jgi:hypothetical protein